MRGPARLRPSPAAALACPSCARDAGPWAAALVAGMIGVPYVVAALAVRAIRKMLSDQPAMWRSQAAVSSKCCCCSTSRVPPGATSKLTLTSVS